MFQTMSKLFEKWETAMRHKLQETKWSYKNNWHPYVRDLLVRKAICYLSEMVVICQLNNKDYSVTSGFIPDLNKNKNKFKKSQVLFNVQNFVQLHEMICK